MATTWKSLLKLCKPDEATPSEILFASWDYMNSKGLSEVDLLSKLSTDERLELRRASASILASLQEDGTGIIVGTVIPKNFEESDFFVPRAFIESLANSKC